MSGPKKSQWQIRQEQFEKIRKEREANRQRQAQQIRAELALIQTSLKRLAQKDKTHAQYVDTRVKVWISDVESHSNDDLRLAWRGLKGIQVFVKQQDEKLDDLIKSRQREAELAKLEAERIAEQKRVLDAALATHFDYFDAIEAEYPELINEGVKQRIENFRAALSVNIQNPQTIQQVQSFKAQFKQLVKEHEEELAKFDYLKEVLKKAVNGKQEESGDGATSLSGIVNGSPIKVHIKAKSSEIRFDTPDDGSCKKAMQTILHQLDRDGIQLGPIQIVKTGEVMHSQQSGNYERERQRQ